MKVLNTYSGYKPLCYIDEDNILVYRKLKLYKFNLCNSTFEYISTLSNSFKYKFGCINRILERILRLEPRTAIRENDYILISFKGFIYKLDINTYKLKIVHKFRDGMNNVLSFSRVSTIEGFEKGIYYGEYLSNDDKKAVSIYRYDEKKEEFLKVYTFKSGYVNHIHQIIEDKYRNRVWVMTGDFDSASAIWYTDDNFKTVKLFFGGKQEYRLCKAFVIEKGLLYATDTPLEDNYIVKIEIDKDVTVSKIHNISGSVIYGVEMKDKYIISTTVEGKNFNNKFKSLFTYKRGNGIKSWNVDLISIDKNVNNMKIIKSFKKDIYPMALCQFGAIQFIENEFEKDVCVCYGNSIKKFDGKMIIFK